MRAMPPATLHSDDILFHDDHLLVLNKPAGVPVHGSRMLEGRPSTLLALARVRRMRMRADQRPNQPE